jgi:hypothetical protein
LFGLRDEVWAYRKALDVLRRAGSTEKRASRAYLFAASAYLLGAVHTRSAPVRVISSSDLGFLAVAGCWGHEGIGGSAALVRLRSPDEPIAEWGCSAWEVAHGSIHAFAVHPVAVVGDGRILPFLPDPLVRLVLLDVDGGGLV